MPLWIRSGSVFLYYMLPDEAEDPPSLQTVSNNRTIAEEYEKLRTTIDEFAEAPQRAEEYLAKNRNSNDPRTRMLCAHAIYHRSDISGESKVFGTADLARYIYAAQALVGKDMQIPPDRLLYFEPYMSLNHAGGYSAYLMEFLSDAAHAASEIGDKFTAVTWLNECIDLQHNIRAAWRKHHPVFEWSGITLPHPFAYSPLQDVYQGLASISCGLGNTAAMAYYMCRRTSLLRNSGQELSDQASVVARALEDANSDIRKLEGRRYPDPNTITTIETKDDRLHTDGSWKKVHIRSQGGVTPRLRSSVFVHEGFLYVFGGEKTSIDGPYYKDFWRIDLQKPDRWESLPSPSRALPRDKDCLGSHGMAVHNGAAYLFMGSATLLRYEFRSSQWTTVKTRFKSDSIVNQLWPYSIVDGMSNSVCFAFSMICVLGKIYVFGGHTVSSFVGVDLFLELDIEKREWRRLSGSLNPVPSYSSPNPREAPALWTNREQTKIFLMYGHVDRFSAYQRSAPHGCPVNYAHDDLWSWDIMEEKWTREKIRGNPPCPRGEMAVVYNRHLDAVITFGGYGPFCPTEESNFSYFADTFVYTTLDSNPVQATENPNIVQRPKTWKQVLTRGFPTYRALAHLVEDPSTGKTYLFSGFFEREFLSAGMDPKRSVRSFADLWELRIDLPGGNFEGVDIEEEKRTAKLGPWQRCFACGSVGRWRKCAGACGGRAFFCDMDCLRDGWKEHKETHRCRKI
ncbi:unnamed protein product [Cyclocybe aegerita]|uniref:Uncharacterized protein n=1 Tax=Cyclocybe aegerita TaxID=1973307 RepID=A0A8S0VZG4_CYCAE|nr:unnamed protein product [Cyclocybe aegerita]